jgi:hypothetical protein
MVAAIYTKFETHIHDESRFINKDGFYDWQGRGKTGLNIQKCSQYNIIYLLNYID